MTRDEVVALLKEVAIGYRAQALACSVGVLPARFKKEMQDRAEKFEASTAAVDAMRCETCGKQICYSRIRLDGCWYWRPREGGNE